MGDTSVRPAASWCLLLILRLGLRTSLTRLATPTSIPRPDIRTLTHRRYDNSITCTAIRRVVVKTENREDVFYFVAPLPGAVVHRRIGRLLYCNRQHLSAIKSAT